MRQIYFRRIILGFFITNSLAIMAQPGPLYDCQGQPHLTTNIEVGVKIQNCGGVEDFGFYERKEYNLENTIVPLCIPLNCIDDKLFLDSNIINSLYAQGFMQFNLVRENDTMKIMIANMKMGSLYPIKFYIEKIPFIKGSFILKLQNHVIVEEQIQDELSLVYSLYNGIYKETYLGWDITPSDWLALKVDKLPKKSLYEISKRGEENDTKDGQKVGPLIACHRQPHLGTFLGKGVETKHCNSREYLGFEFENLLDRDLDSNYFCIPLDCTSDVVYDEINLEKLSNKFNIQLTFVKGNKIMKVTIENIRIHTSYDYKSYFIKKIPFIEGEFILKLKDPMIDGDPTYHNDYVYRLQLSYSGIYTQDSMHRWDITPPDWQALKVREKSRIRMFFKRLFKRT